ncbi:MAG: oligosaccharide flippase family protein [Thermoanaerobaculia bacterium]
MTQLRHNVVANFAGQGWSALVALAFVPLYVRYLGIEAYGLIGVFAALQAWLSILDIGMTPTLNREMSRYLAGARSEQGIRDLLATLEALCLALAVVIAAAVWAASGILARDWLQSDALPVDTIANALRIAGIVLALRFVEGMYRGALFGLEKQVWYNVVASLLATLRHGGAVVVLLTVSNTIEAFFVWQAIVSLVSIALFGAKVHSSVPKVPVRPRISAAALRDVAKFAAGVMIATGLGLLLTQIDKVVLSRILPLSAFGYYAFAGTVAAVLYSLATPVSQAVFPRMVQLAASGAGQSIGGVYHASAQLVTVLTAPLLMILAVFDGHVILLWSGDASLAAGAGLVLSVLVLGAFLYTQTFVPYQCQLANGWTDLAVKTNLVAVAVFVPLLLWLVPRYGAIAAAWTWAGVNAFCLAAQVIAMHTRIMKGERGRWFLHDLALPAGAAAAIVIVARIIHPGWSAPRGVWIAFLIAVGLISSLAAMMTASEVRQAAIAAMARARTAVSGGGPG